MPPAFRQHSFLNTEAFNDHDKTTTTVKPRNCKQMIWDGAELRHQRRATDNITCNFPSKTSSMIMLRKNIQVQRKTTQIQNIENVLVQKYILAGIWKRMQETLNKTVGCDYLA